MRLYVVVLPVTYLAMVVLVHIYSIMHLPPFEARPNKYIASLYSTVLNVLTNEHVTLPCNI